METFSGENTDEYFKAMDDKIQGLMKRETWEIVLRISISDHDVLPVRWSSSARGNLIEKSGHLRHNIVWGGMSRRDCLMNP